MPGSPVWREDDNVHWLTEVIGGFSLGLSYLLATIWLVESYRRRTARAETVSLAGGDWASLRIPCQAPRLQPPV